MAMIEVDGVTKDYGGGKGVFDASFAVDKGECMGFLGPNGAGKTTTIRQLMGFIRPDAGRVSVAGQDCFKQAANIARITGYLPGEIAFIENMTGRAFIEFSARMRGNKDLARAHELMDFFELDAGGKTRRMSKGMKQKVGLVLAFMSRPEILVLDEPTSGLDPLMQKRFIDLILEEKKRGATILMSSHTFEEIERTCERTVIIRAGHIVAVEEIAKLRRTQKKQVQARFATPAAAAAFAAAWPGAVADGERVKAEVKGEIDPLIKALAAQPVVDLELHAPTLEEAFLHFYGGEPA